MRFGAVLAVISVLTIVVPQSRARAASPEPLIVTYVQTNSQSLDLDTAIQNGYLADEGFKPEFATNSGSVQSTQLLLTGAVNLALLQTEGLITAVAHGTPEIAGIASTMKRVDWMLVGQPGMKSISQLRGKTVGFSGLRVSEYWMTEDLLKKNGVAANQFDGIQVGTTATKFAALTSGSISAAVLYEPTASLAVTKGFSKLAELGVMPNYVPGIYTVDRKWAAVNQNGIRLSRALQRAHAWLYDPKNWSAVINLMKQYSKISDDVANSVYDKFFVNEKIYSPDGSIDLAAVNQGFKTLIDHNELRPNQIPEMKDLLLPKDQGGLWK